MNALNLAQGELLAFNDFENHFDRFAIVIFIPAVFSLEDSPRAC